MCGAIVYKKIGFIGETLLDDPQQYLTVSYTLNFNCK